MQSNTDCVSRGYVTSGNTSSWHTDIVSLCQINAVIRQLCPVLTPRLPGDKRDAGTLAGLSGFWRGLQTSGCYQQREISPRLSVVVVLNQVLVCRVVLNHARVSAFLRQFPSGRWHWSYKAGGLIIPVSGYNTAQCLLLWYAVIAPCYDKLAKNSLCICFLQVIFSNKPFNW